MKYLPQLLIIFFLSLLGELMNLLIPLPIPGSIYGMVLLFLALAAKMIKIEQVKDVGTSLTSLLPVLFVAPIVSLLDCWDRIRAHLIPILGIILVSTLVCFVISGLVTQHFSGKGGKQHD